MSPGSPVPLRVACIGSDGLRRVARFRDPGHAAALLRDRAPVRLGPLLQASGRGQRMRVALEAA